MTKTRRIKSSHRNVHGRRRGPPEQSLRPIQISVPDVGSRAYAREAHRQSLLVAQSPQEKDDQAFVDAISCWADE